MEPIVCNLLSDLIEHSRNGVGTRKAYRVVIGGDAPKYVLAASNQAAIVAAVKTRTEVKCRPLSASDLLDAITQG